MGFHDRDYNRYDGGGGGGGGFRSGGLQWPTGSIVSRLIILNVGIYLWDSIMWGSSRGSALLIEPWAFFSVDKAIYGWQVWRFVTYQFLHSHESFLHIFSNMLGLFFFGRMIESWWGSRRFLAFYLLCGVSGAVVAVGLGTIPGLIMFGPQVTLVGASGSVFGILMACAMLYPHHRVMLLFPPIPMTMRTLATFFLAMAALKVTVGSGNAGGEAAHLGGAALGFFLVRNPRRLDWADNTHRRGTGKGRWQKKQEVSQRDSKEVDRILSKVKAQGLHGLSPAERRTLQKATERQREAR